MACTINIPDRILENFGDGISKLISVLKQMKNCQEKEIILDFSATKFMNPFFIGGLVCCMKHMQDKGTEFSLNHQLNPHISSYLKTICFPETYTQLFSLGQSDNGLEDYTDKSYIPLISFNTGFSNDITVIRENILSAILHLIKRQLNFSEKEMVPIRYFISELTDNINEHSKSSNGYIFAQYYPGSNYLDLCICDSGQGILASYINNPKFSPENDTEALRMAIEGKSTKNLPESRGFGISTTRNMLINGLRGRLFLWSGHSAFIQRVKNEAIIDINPYSFQGTFIALRLPTILPGSFDFYKFIER